MLEQRGFHDGAALNTRRQIGPEDEIAAQEFLKNQYSSSADPNLKNLLGVYSSDFDRVVQTVALGYCHVGTTKTGVLKAHETELVLAAAIAGSGATRSAIIHGKAALVAGNSVAALRATYEMAETINKWNNVAFVLVVAEDLATGLSGGR
ncbi:hypothetical protein SBRCBS47491_004266 [Sporothrix bragantina]|uniref:Carboxymuconolactone decarboxylase-like domain-containing protein n=1 Tax=Sporothrix bragantina TaxID=671064 RepID=A0ABP0BMB5_9PEZI